MNLQQFASLKVGDKVENKFTRCVAEITEVRNDGVRASWYAGTPSFFYSVSSTTWLHWSKVGDEA